VQVERESTLKSKLTNLNLFWILIGFWVVVILLQHLGTNTVNVVSVYDANYDEQTAEFNEVDRPLREPQKLSETAAPPVSSDQQLENTGTPFDSPYSQVASAAASTEASAADQQIAPFQNGIGSNKSPEPNDAKSQFFVTKADEPRIAAPRPAKAAVKGTVDVLRWTGEVPVVLPRVNSLTRHGIRRHNIEPPELDRKRLARGLVTAPINGTIDAQSSEPYRRNLPFAVPIPSIEKQSSPANALRSETRIPADQADHAVHSQSVKTGGETLLSRQDGNKHGADVIRDLLKSSPSGHMEQAAKALRLPTALAQGLHPLPRRRPLYSVDGTSRTMVASKAELPVMRNDVYGGDGINARLAAGHTQLTIASVKGEQQAIDVLLRRGADPNIPAQDNATALMYASWIGDVESVDRLLDAGADPNRMNVDGKTALMAASRNGQADVVELLLKKGAEPDQQTANGWTAIMYAAWWGREEVTRILLEYRANVGILNLRGKSAVELAAERKQIGIKALLR